MSSEFLVQELPDPFPVPPFRVFEIHVKGKISLVENTGVKLAAVRPVNREIEDRDVQEVDVFIVGYDKFEGFSRLFQTLRGSPEEKVNIGGNPCFFHALQDR